MIFFNLSVNIQQVPNPLSTFFRKMTSENKRLPERVFQQQGGREGRT